MRTTLTIDDDVMGSVRDLAYAHKAPLGQVVSELLRRALQPVPRIGTGSDGLPIVTVPAGARPITSDDVARELAAP